MHLNTCGKSLAVGIILWATGLAGMAQPKPLEELHENLLRAVCLNDWDSAIALVNPLIAFPDVTTIYRQSLLDLRDQLTDMARAGTVVPAIANCEAVLKRYVLSVATVEPPLDWPTANIADILERPFPRPPRTQVSDQEEAEALAALDKLDIYDIAALSPALFIDLATGSGVSSGQVDSTEQIYTFFAGLGDLISIDVDVTQILPGALRQDDDTQMFLFDATGTLIAANNDDDEGLQSKLENILIPRTGRYYVAVTTYDNAPILDDEGRILGWSLTGGSAVAYTLTLWGATPTAQLILTNYGIE